MQKTAKPGERSIINKLRDAANISGKMAEKFFNPQFKAVMDHIRIKDDRIRSLVVGKQLGDAGKDTDGDSAPQSYGIALKDLIKQAKSNLNKREFMSMANDLSLFHDKARQIMAQINSIKSKVDEVHHDFLFSELTPEQQEQFAQLKTRFDAKAARQKALLIKEAGVLGSISDFFHNLHGRGKALAFWEKRFPKKVNEIKNASNNLLQRSENFLDSIIESLKEMALARANRSVDDYMRGADKIDKAFNIYESGKGGFKDFHTFLMPYIKDMEAYQARQLTGTGLPTTLNKDTPGQSAPVVNDVPVPNLELDLPEAAPKVPAPVTEQALSNLEKNRETGAVAVPANVTQEALSNLEKNKSTDIEKAPDTSRDDQLRKSMELVNNINAKIENKAHRKFYSSLESLSNESPSMLALFIKKYANSITVSDPHVASKLFKIAKSIKV